MIQRVEGVYILPDDEQMVLWLRVTEQTGQTMFPPCELSSLSCTEARMQKMSLAFTDALLPVMRVLLFSWRLADCRKEEGKKIRKRKFKSCIM